MNIQDMEPPFLTPGIHELWTLCSSCAKKGHCLVQPGAAASGAAPECKDVGNEGKAIMTHAHGLSLHTALGLQIS